VGHGTSTRHRRLGNDDESDGFVEKQKWARWRTYEQGVARIMAAESVVDGYACLLERLERRQRR
jgi:hypothetical protein